MFCSSIWLRNHSCFLLLDMISDMSFQFLGESSSLSIRKLSPSYPKSGQTSILVSCYSICCSSLNRNGFEDIFTLQFLIFNLLFMCGLVSSTVVSLGLNLRCWDASSSSYLLNYLSVGKKLLESCVLYITEFWIVSILLKSARLWTEFWIVSILL